MASNRPPAADWEGKRPPGGAEDQDRSYNFRYSKLLKRSKKMNERA